MLPSQLQVCGVKSLTESKQNINIKLGSLSTSGFTGQKLVIFRLIDFTAY